MHSLLDRRDQLMSRDRITTTVQIKKIHNGVITNEKVVYNGPVQVTPVIVSGSTQSYPKQTAHTVCTTSNVSGIGLYCLAGGAGLVGGYLLYKWYTTSGPKQRGDCIQCCTKCYCTNVSGDSTESNVSSDSEDVTVSNSVSNSVSNNKTMIIDGNEDFVATNDSVVATNGVSFVCKCPIHDAPSKFSSAAIRSMFSSFAGGVVSGVSNCASKYSECVETVRGYHANNPVPWLITCVAGGTLLGAVGGGLNVLTSDIKYLHKPKTVLLARTLENTIIGSGIGLTAGATLGLTALLWIPLAGYTVVPSLGLVALCYPINLYRSF